MRIRSTREHRILVIKTSVRWLLYYLVIFISFLIMTSGTLSFYRLFFRGPDRLG